MGTREVGLNTPAAERSGDALLNRSSRAFPGLNVESMAIADSTGCDYARQVEPFCGGGIRLNKFTRCMGNHGTPDLKPRSPIPVTTVFTGWV